MIRQVEKHTQSVVLSIIALLGILIAADMTALYFLSDFWHHPAVLKTKLGIAANEILNLVFSTALVLSLTLLVRRVTSSRMVRITVLLLSIPIVLLLVGGWSFFSLFDKFIGIYALQMITQDGGQMLSFLKKMPSSINSSTLLLVIGIPTAVILVVLSVSQYLAYAKLIVASLTVLLVTASIPASLMWNKPYIQQLTKIENIDRDINRVQAVEYEILSRMAGPFSAFNSNLSSHLLRDTNFKNIALSPDSMKRRVEFMPITDKAAKQYNIIYVLVESLRPDMLSAFGGDNKVMPTVNALSENSIIFDNMWAQASHSNYADISALSGQYPLRSVNIHFYPKNSPYPRSLPYDVLGPLGYHSGIFSSQNEDWGLMSNYLESDHLSIFSHVGSKEKSTGESLHRSNTGITLNMSDTGFVSLDFEGFMYRSTGMDIERLDEITTDNAISWLDGVPQDEPYFMYFNYQASHSPYNSLPENFERTFLTMDGEIPDKVRAGETLEMPLNYVTLAYKDSLHYVDQNIQKLIDHVQIRGESDSTIFVISADTSMSLTEAFLGNGGALLPEVLKIPAIIAIPGQIGQTRIDRLAGQIDIMPTVLELAGASPHPASQGIDLLGTDFPKRVVFSVAQTPAAHQYSAIYNDWQLVHDYESSENQLTYLGDLEDQQSSELSEDRKSWLASRLQKWINAQLAYYSNPGIHETYFPPKHVVPADKNQSFQLTEDVEDR